MGAHPRLLGFDEGPFRFGDASVPVVGVMTRGAARVEAVVVGKVEVDGWDATHQVIGLARRLPGGGPDAVMIDGVTLGGMNVVDIADVARTLERTVLAVTRDRPDRARMLAAMERTPGAARRAAMLPPDSPAEVRIEGHALFVQIAGEPADEARLLHLVKASLHEGYTPEPLRLAHHIATALVRGVSGTAP